VALHPEGALVDLELVEHAPGSPWFERVVRATPAACELATKPRDVTTGAPRLPVIGRPDERLIEIFAKHAEAITVVRGRLDQVEQAARHAGARLVGGHGCTHSAGCAIRDAVTLDAIPVVVAHEIDERTLRLLGRGIGPRWVLIPSADELTIATSA
jgi:hypothetical protein